MAGPGNILIRVGAEAGQAISELSKVDKALGSTMTTSEKMSAGIKKAAVPAALALGAIAVAAGHAAKAAAEDAAAQEKLAGILERATGASKAQVAATEDWISKISLATGVADDELRPALGKIAIATKDVTKAQKYLKAAMDISAASGKDIDVVSTAIAKGYTGQTAALAKLVPGLSEAAKQSKDFDTIMGELNKTTGGAAAESASTAAGQYKVLQNQMAELEETLGAALLPVIEALLPVLRSLASLAADNTGAIKILVGVVAGLSLAILAANVAMKAYAAAQVLVKVATAAWTAAQWLLNAALDANPIGLVIIAVAALAAGIVIAYNRSETFRSIVGGAFDAVESAARGVERAFDATRGAAIDAFNWITNHWKLALFAFGPIGAAVYLISENFDRIKGAAKAAFDVIKGGVDAVVDAIKELLDLIGKIHFPKIPHLPGLPFGHSAFAIAPSSPFPSARAAGAGLASGAGGVTINVYGAVDPEGTARAIRRILTASDRRQGKVV